MDMDALADKYGSKPDQSKSILANAHKIHCNVQGVDLLAEPDYRNKQGNSVIDKKRNMVRTGTEDKLKKTKKAPAMRPAGDGEANIIGKEVEALVAFVKAAGGIVDLMDQHETLKNAIPAAHSKAFNVSILEPKVAQHC